MSINYKKVNDVPELVELTGTEKFIVNSNGKARQVSAELVGGGAEATVFYVIAEGPSEVAESSGGSGLYDETGTEVSVDAVFDALENGIVKIKPMSADYTVGYLVVTYARYDSTYGVLYFIIEGGSIQSLNVGESSDS